MYEYSFYEILELVCNDTFYSRRSPNTTTKGEEVRQLYFHLAFDAFEPAAGVVFPQILTHLGPVGMHLGPLWFWLLELASRLCIVPCEVYIEGRCSDLATRRKPWLLDKAGQQIPFPEPSVYNVFHAKEVKIQILRKDTEQREEDENKEILVLNGLETGDVDASTFASASALRRTSENKNSKTQSTVPLHWFCSTSRQYQNRTSSKPMDIDTCFGKGSDHHAHCPPGKADEKAQQTHHETLWEFACLRERVDRNFDNIRSVRPASLRKLVTYSA